MPFTILAILPLAAALVFFAMAVWVFAKRRPLLLQVSAYYLLLSVPVFSMAAISVYRSLAYAHPVGEGRFLLFACCAYLVVLAVMARKSGQFMALGVDHEDFLEALSAATGFSGEISEDNRVPSRVEGQFISVHVHPGLFAAQAGLLPGPDQGSAANDLSRLAESLLKGNDMKRVVALCLVLPAALCLAACFYVFRENSRMDGKFWMERAVALAGNENSGAALAAAEKAVQKGGKTSERAMGLYGLLLSASGEKGRAKEVFLELLAEDPKDPEALSYAARFLAAGAKPPDPDRAVYLAEKAVNLSPECVPCLDSLAVSFAAAGRMPEAIKTQEEMVGLLGAARADEKTLAAMRRKLADYRRQAGLKP